MYSFLKRRGGGLSLRKPTGTSFSRSLVFDKEDDSRFFQILEEDFEKTMYEADKVFSADEAVLTHRSRYSKKETWSGNFDTGGTGFLEYALFFFCMNAGEIHASPHASISAALS
jgi:hypothetical protein